MKELIAQAMLIPVDPRNGKPLVTSAMKATCIGEFHVDVACSCECDPGDECAVCCGQGAGTYTHKQDIPWTTIKDIYKTMAGVAAAGVISPPVPFAVGVDRGEEGGDRTAITIQCGKEAVCFTLKASEVKHPEMIQGKAIEYCPVCPFSSNPLEVEQEDGAQRLTCPSCGYTRNLP